MNLKDKSVLVTGAGGFVGSHLIENLLKIGSNVTAFVRYNSRNDWGMLEQLPKDMLDSMEIISGDLRDPDAITHAVKDVDVIFHLGALIAIPYSYVNPREVVETNILGTLNVLSAAKENEIEKVVHTSTSEVYGSAEYVPIDEYHPLQGQSPYSASKIGADKIAESYYRSFELPVATIRPFNTYGPRQSARAVIPTIISQSLSQNKIRLGSLEPTRDYTHVFDTVKGFIKIAESPKSVGEVINIGSNFEVSIEGLATKIFSILNKDIEILTDSTRLRPKDSEVERLWCDNNKAQEILKWEPKISLDEGLRNVVEWIINHQDFYKSEIYNL